MSKSSKRPSWGLAPGALAFLLFGACTEAPIPEPSPSFSVHAGATPTARFDATGRLWVVFEQGGHVYLTSSLDRGATYAPSIPVHSQAEAIETNGESRPKVALGNGGEVYVSWTRKLEGRFTGEIRFARSLDGGRTFGPPLTVNDDGLPIGHRFESLVVDSAGDVILAWVDKRDLEVAKTRGEKYRGAAIYSAISQDQGATFAANRKVADFGCECCRIAIAAAPGGGAAILWRHVFEPDVRDHAFAVVGRDDLATPLQRATRDGWHLNGCPHHGAALAVAAQGGYHMAWFTAAMDQPAAYYGRFDPASGKTEHRTLLAKSSVAHPDVLETEAGQVLVAWKELVEGETRVYARQSADDGARWSEPHLLAVTSGASDHPFLLTQGSKAFLSWHTAKEGLQILPITLPRNPAVAG